MVTLVKTNSANYKYDNSNDPNKIYNISANCNAFNRENTFELTSMDGGIVEKDGAQVATFNIYDSSRNYSFNVQSVQERIAIMEAIDNFYIEVSEDLNK